VPANLPREYYVKEAELKNAKTIEEKIKILEELISIAPKHKGTENLIANLRKRIAKLKSEAEKKKSKIIKKSDFKKVGDFLVTIISENNFFSLSILNQLTNSKFDLKDFDKVLFGIMKYRNAEIQINIIPSYAREKFDYVLKSSDIILSEEKIKELDIEKLKELIWNELNLIEVFVRDYVTKKLKFSIALRKNSKISDLIEKIRLKEEKILSIKVERNGFKLNVNKNFILEENDIVEIKTI